MKILNFAQRTQPIYGHETTLHFLPQYYFWAQLGHASFKDMLQFWVSLWLNTKVYTYSIAVKPQIGQLVKTIEIEPGDIFNESKQVINAFYNSYGALPEYLIIGTEKYQELNYHVAFRYELRTLTHIHGVKFLVLPTIEGIVALPNLEKLQWKYTN
jgi:hypothetical protein